MYFKDDKQISLFEFGQSAGLTLDPENRWVKMAMKVDWDKIEDKYCGQFCPDNGAPAKPVRLAVCSLLIQKMEGLPDERLVLHIQENPHMQYFCGIKECSWELPFVPSLMVSFRKRFGDNVIREINEMLFAPEKPGGDDDNDRPNNGTLIMDTTCTPANITYPQDIKLCNEAREKTEEMVEAMHIRGEGEKPRLDKQKARQAYLKVAKSKKRGGNILRKAIKKQLSYIRRNLGYIDNLMKNYDKLSPKQKAELDTIRRLYDQQKHMIDNRTHTVDDRIVSISQPHVRPIVRGKAAAKTEFGAKVAVSVIGGYAFVDNISWDAYNESSDLIPAIEKYHKKHGCYPEAVMVDKIYRTRNNIKYCNSKGIRISGPRLGRPKKGEIYDKKQAYIDSGIRNAVEGKFGIGKIKYGLDRVMAKLKDTSETSISLAFLAMNLLKSLCVSLRFLLSYRNSVKCGAF
ncbi:MAG: IS5 family transposase [Oscillospiraceae bacterium]|nr:IS5 family transposase [Oscillospiraceae bacterium]